MLCLKCGTKIAEVAVIGSPKALYHEVGPKLIDLEREELWAVALNTRNGVIAREQLYRGTINSTLVRPAEVFEFAIKNGAAGVAVAHNHPSGDPDPSPEDAALTRRLVESGKLLDIEFTDHLIVGNGGRWVSMRQRDIGFD